MTACRTVLVVVALILLPAVASGEVFTVVLENGTIFETRYRPMDAEWDSSISMILTDRGNWIALPKEDILDITSAIEESGFGVQIDTSTILLGWTYNGGLEEEGAEGEGILGPNGQLIFPTGVQLPQGLTAAPGPYSLGTPGAGVPGQQPSSYTIDQFVNTPVVGSPDAAASGGIPLEYTVY